MGELRCKLLGQLSGGKVTLTGSGCCSMWVVISRLSLRGPLSSSQLPIIRRDWLGISTFRQRSKDMCLRDVVDVKVSPIGGQKVIQMEAYVVPEISSIQNGHLELVKGECPHLKGLWFSDVCKGLDELEIDVLMGADYLWNFQKDCMIRGKPDKPVAVEMELGWVD